MKFWTKLNGPKNEVLAACDENMLGKTIKGNVTEITVSERFYKGELVGNKELLSLLNEKQNINIIGKNAVALAEKAKLLNSHAEINNIPYAIIVRL